MSSYLLSDVDRMVYQTLDDFDQKSFHLSAKFLWLVFQNFIPRVKKTKMNKKVYSGESKVLVFFKNWSGTISDVWQKQFGSVIKTLFDVPE